MDIAESTDHDVCLFLGSDAGGFYAADIHSGSMKPVQAPADVGKPVKAIDVGHGLVVLCFTSTFELYYCLMFIVYCCILLWL
jgi:hypothetical protein